MPLFDPLATTCPAQVGLSARTASPGLPTGRAWPLLHPLATTRLARIDRGTARMAPALAPDLLTAAWDALAADAALESLFGRAAIGSTGWLWYEADGLPPSRALRPYLILGPLVGPTTRLEAPHRGIAVTTELQITLHGTRDLVATIADEATRVLREGSLKFMGGSVAFLWRINPFEGAVREPGRWPRGEIVWSLVVRYRVLMGGNV